jgi:hypothetical protein
LYPFIRPLACRFRGTEDGFEGGCSGCRGRSEQLSAALADLAAGLAAADVAVDPIRRRNVLMADLRGNVFLVGAGGEHRGDVRVAESVRRDVLNDRR